MEKQGGTHGGRINSNKGVQSQQAPLPSSSSSAKPVPLVQVKREPRPPPAPILSPSTSYTPGSMGHLSYPRPPSPTPSFASTTVTALVPLRQNRPWTEPGPVISVRPLESMIDPEENMSVVSSSDLTVTPTPTGSNSAFQSSRATTTSSSGMQDWRIFTNSVRDRLQHILESKQFRDVVFEFRERDGMSKERIEAHTLILRIASPVFDKMFQEVSFGILNQNQTSPTETVIPITSVDSGTFKQLLKYIYTDHADLAQLDENGMLNLLRASILYGVHPLYLECVQTLQTGGISNDATIELCGMADTFNDTPLLNTAFNHIANKAFEIFPSDCFLHLSIENLMKLVDRDDLRIDELSLFKSVYKWGQFKCIQDGLEMTPLNMRRVLQDLIPKIRFPVMSANDFTVEVATLDILTPEEKVEIFQYICIDSSKRDQLPSITFKTTQRYSKKDLELEDSFSDFQEGGSSQNNDSPGREPSLASNANTECADITTTEPESETASNVSTSSDNRKRSRKLERSQSTKSSESSKKRRKESKRRHLSSSKSPHHHQLDELFGDDNFNSVTLEGGVISLKTFIIEIKKRRNEIEVIKLEDVKIDDFTNMKRGECSKVHFPNLKEFNLNVKIDDSINSKIPELPIDNLLFMSTQYKPWLLEDLWGLKIEITLIINNVIILKISHKSDHIIINKFHGGADILKHLRDKPIKSIVYSYPTISAKLFPPCLKRLVILGVFPYPGMWDFLLQFKDLKDLTVVNSASKDLSVFKLNSTFLSHKNKLRKLRLGDFKLEVEQNRYYNVEGLYLWRTSWDSSFEINFFHNFPKLKELCFFGPVKGSLVLLRNLIKIASLTEFICWNCDWQLSPTEVAENTGEAWKLFTAWGLPVGTKNFTLSRTNGVWTGERLAFFTSHAKLHSKMQYDFLHVDVTTFINPEKCKEEP